jgi:hypothetical protein
MLRDTRPGELDTHLLERSLHPEPVLPSGPQPWPTAAALRPRVRQRELQRCSKPIFQQRWQLGGEPWQLLSSDAHGSEGGIPAHWCLKCTRNAMKFNDRPAGWIGGVAPRSCPPPAESGKKELPVGSSYRKLDGRLRRISRGAPDFSLGWGPSSARGALREVWLR